MCKALCVRPSFESRSRSYWVNVCHPDERCSSSTDASCSPAARMFPNSTDPLYACMVARNGHFSQFVISKACSTKLGDQSIHNFAFRRSWKRLPRSLGLNVDARRWSGTDSDTDAPARMIHFFGEPKPWDPHARASLPAVSEYRRVCPLSWNSGST